MDEAKMIMLYFAYGSNMDWNEMRGCCPSAKFVAIARFADRILKFTRRSKNRDCGVADVVFEKSRDVWGVVYEVPDTEIGFLDFKEGFRPGRENMKNSYMREEHHVFLDSTKEKPLTVSVYVGNPELDPPLPNQAYKDLIIRGAKNWHLPDAYIQSLNEIKVV